MKLRIKTTTDHYKIVQALRVDNEVRYFVKYRKRGILNLFKWNLYLIGQTANEATEGFETIDKAMESLKGVIGREVVIYKDINAKWVNKC